MKKSTLSTVVNGSLHVLCWLIFVQLFFEIGGLLESLKRLWEGKKEMDDAFLILPGMVFLFYFNGHFLISRFQRKQYWKHFMLWLAGAFMLTFLLELGIYWLLLDNGWFLPVDTGEFVDYFGEFGILTLVAGSTYGVARLTMRNRQIRNELERQQLATELKFLKSQVDPHFLFNTLNTIYSLAQEEKAPKTTDAILQLSDLMRFNLGEAQATQVPLEREINYLESYIQLQGIRLGEHNRTTFKVKGDPEGLMVAPMVFIPFVENAFKYGVSYQNPQPIEILFNISPEKIDFSISNFQLQNGDPQKSHTIGISNAKKRLQIIYPESHSLTIVSKERFEVMLEIRLK